MVKKRKIGLTKHSIERIQERLNINETEIQSLVDNAWLFGRTLRFFKGSVKEYILDRLGYETNGKYRIVIYKEIVFIFTAQHPKLITTYELPEELR
jgi:hypothetical protein